MEILTHFVKLQFYPSTVGVEGFVKKKPQKNHWYKYRVGPSSQSVFLFLDRNVGFDLRDFLRGVKTLHTV